ncbi:multidrug efflux transporter AcrB transmembrane domain-containing protein [Pseudovirgaria hyperparasitica]|uniref:Multidrug efflux transporter AcrB transmembrane domain-containing protein n=1 Tax=Pseudovirgaria hyperparasitica TaxID=470096 RepID=A0A6A6WEN3_9PEZI|nr:multidrug efflux transporter AcrB transmembrane domain-containing protein [Pseudovirgaria hyperparasitica]KAF2760450.1 multidrug efflux transporter AcrB transmembrane domain-containing protein [Pseudovirgaria hyperparasitica]
MRWNAQSWWRLTALLLSSLYTIDAVEPGWTKKHEEGRCAIRGHCGKESWLGAEIPCVDNGFAERPDDDARDKLVALCGEEWADTDVCCSSGQIDDMAANFGRVNAFVAGCPACKKNFYNLFCTFTCSPDQSTFVNVTEIAPYKNTFRSMAVDVLITDKFGTGFYDSCKDVKFGPTNNNAMALIGGGAHNFTEFFKFLGKKQPPFHSPFQIDFPRSDEKKFSGMKFNDPIVRACNDHDPAYRCACVDCPKSCTELPEVTEQDACTVGLLHCFSFAVVLVYSIFVALLVIAVSGHVAYQSHSKQKNERLRLIRDIEPSEDDEGDIFHHTPVLERPTEQYFLNTIFDRIFYRLGLVCAQFPGITIGSTVVFVGLLSLGWVRFAVEKDPVKLWVAPNSAAAVEKQYFDKNFGPFFRAEQAFLVNDTQGSRGPVLDYETLAWWFDVENRIQRFKSEKEGVTLKDVCFNPTGAGCAVQSVTGYFQGDFSLVDPDTWYQHIEDCAKNAFEDSCRPRSNQPLEPHLIFGDYGDSVLDSTALVVTWVVNNNEEGSDEAETAADWEAGLQNALINAQREAKERGLRLSFNTEISLEQELNKSSNTDARIVVISYVIMFLYASLSLGSTTLTAKTILRNPSSALVQSKFMLGIFGIIIVLMSVSASVGLFSAAGIKVTLIIAEVIPFLVLAVGVDNIFLIVHEFERVNISSPEAPIPERVARALGRMGPSILFSATAETAAFALGTAVGMPAVRNFAAYAAGAVFINALLQVTMFIAVLSLNQKRVEDSRIDCFPCLKVRRSNMSSDGTMVFGIDEEGSLQKFIRRSYAPTLLGKKVKVAIVAIFLGLFTAGLALLPHVQLGLEQRDALPSGSYLIDYFDDVAEYLGVGPPVYFIARNLDVAEHGHQIEVCGRFGACDEFSLANILEGERKRPEISYIATATASWIDDFFAWLNPALDCCHEHDGDTETCFADRNPPWSPSLVGMPEGEEFVHYLTKWLHATSDVNCPLGGKAAYSDAVVVDNATHSISASHFRTSHTPLRTQEDFINSYAAARRIADDIGRSTSSEIFPYSKHYIFFDQYASIVHLSTALIGSALAIILLVSAILLGSLRTAIVVTITVGMTVVDIIGTMSLAGVSLNAVSLVNLIICVGISVEFCAHIARAFTFPSSAVMERAPRNRFKAKEVRAWTALVNVGGSVFSGITITKLLGVCVLAFTRSKIFEIYYFRVWLALVLWAASHALIFLPVMLSIFGGKGFSDPESDGGLEQDLRNRRYRPLLAAEDYDSDD